MENLKINQRGYSILALDNVKNPTNVGHVLRAAHAFKSSAVIASGSRFQKVATDTSKAYKHIPLIITNDVFNNIPYDCVPVAVELKDNARDITNYIHPERAFYVFGAEDNTLGERVLSRCRDIIYIPTEICLNLAACVNVVLYDRMLKMKNK